MSSEICPKCGAIIAATDTHCMECGADIAKARREMVEREKRERGGPKIDPRTHVSGARAGLSVQGETSEKVRLTTFDKHLAEKLGRERAAVIVTAVLGLIIGIVILLIGLGALKSAGGLAAVRDLSYRGLREQGMGAFGDVALTASILVLLGVAGLLCGVGQSIRVITATQAIAAVRRGERPLVVAISNCTKAGLLLASLLAPPLGLVLGIIFKLGQDEETRRLGGSMILAAIIAIVFVGGHVLWNLLSGFTGSAGTEPSTPINATSS